LKALTYKPIFGAQVLVQNIWVVKFQGHDARSSLIRNKLNTSTQVACFWLKGSVVVVIFVSSEVGSVLPGMRIGLNLTWPQRWAA